MMSLYNVAKRKVALTAPVHTATDMTGIANKWPRLVLAARTENDKHSLRKKRRISTGSHDVCVACNCVCTVCMAARTSGLLISELAVSASPAGSVYLPSPRRARYLQLSGAAE
jgi:hypothetical protein